MDLPKVITKRLQMKVHLATYNQNGIKILSIAFIHHCQIILNKRVESFKLFPFIGANL